MDKRNLEEQKKTVVVRGLSIGEGMPKICVPLTGGTEAELCDEARALAEAGAQMAEWRMDWFAGVACEESVLSVLRQLRGVLKEIPLLATFRTQREGGNAPIETAQYEDLYRTVIRSRSADLVDLELFFDEEIVRRLIGVAKEQGVKTVLSSHDFQATPPGEEILRRLRRMRRWGGDIAKIAVMPRCAADVAELLKATAQCAEQLDCPIVAMSMSGQGAVSRIAGQIFGSAITFATVGKPSAPGQLPLAELAEMLSVIDRALSL